MNTDSLALKLENIDYSYGSYKALDQVSLEVPTGRFVALLGANGAGKSTLFSIISGLYSAHAGSVAVFGHDLRQHTLDALRAMGVVFQRTTLDMDLTVVQNLRYATALQGILPAESRRRISQVVEQHGLAGFENRKVAALSGGQRRRVELARALMHKPSLLLLDEPTVGLDLQSRGEFVDHVKTLATEHDTGVLWATHLMDEVSPEDDVYIVDKGRVLANGNVSSLLHEHGAVDVTALFNTLVPRAVT